ncbi:MAG: hypothetical protein WBK77_09490, partial [Alphaproteobacteria bacterium]
LCMFGMLWRGVSGVKNLIGFVLGNGWPLPLLFLPYWSKKTHLENPNAGIADTLKNFFSPAATEKGRDITLGGYETLGKDIAGAAKWAGGGLKTVFTESVVPAVQGISAKFGAVAAFGTVAVAGLAAIWLWKKAWDKVSSLAKPDPVPTPAAA